MQVNLENFFAVTFCSVHLQSSSKKRLRKKPSQHFYLYFKMTWTTLNQNSHTVYKYFKRPWARIGKTIFPLEVFSATYCVISLLLENMMQKFHMKTWSYIHYSQLVDICPESITKAPDCWKKCVLNKHILCLYFGHWNVWLCVGDEEEEENVTLTLQPCGNCGRNFNIDVLVGVCLLLQCFRC